MSELTHSMIDLETLGVGPNAAIVTIGFCNFDPWGELKESGKIQVDVGDCVKQGMVVHDSTFRWWITQDLAARDALLGMNPKPLAEAIDWLDTWLQDVKHVWGNGANFDISILETAYGILGKETPWRFFDVRCYRTVKAMFPSVPRVEPEVPHCAQSDARAQAQHLINIYREHGL